MTKAELEKELVEQKRIIRNLKAKCNRQKSIIDALRSKNNYYKQEKLISDGIIVRREYSDGEASGLIKRCH